MSVLTNDVTHQSGQPAAAASAEFTTYDVTDVELYTDDAQGIDTTWMMVN